MLTKHPELFTDANYKSGILRLYSDTADFNAAYRQHVRLGSLDRKLNHQEILEQYPVFQSAGAQDMLGGAMVTKGFTLQVQDFCKGLIREMQSKGASFRWETTLTRLDRNASDQIKGVCLDDGDIITADHYIISTGAYAGDVFCNTPVANVIHGVLGAWLTLPNVYPELQNSIKIHKTGHIGEDSNVTLASVDNEEVLVIGSGYGYTGTTKENGHLDRSLTILYNSINHTAKTYFPEAYEELNDSALKVQRFIDRMEFGMPSEDG
jgi:D-amino-acid dehydrogenase